MRRRRTRASPPPAPTCPSRRSARDRTSRRSCSTSGITSLNIEYGGESDQGGVYHSNYDTFEHYVRFGDPQFAYGVAEAQTAGHVVLRVADADVLPLQFTGFADTVEGYVEELHKLAEDKRKSAEELGKLLDQNVVHPRGRSHAGRVASRA